MWEDTIIPCGAVFLQTNIKTKIMVAYFVYVENVYATFSDQLK